MSLLNRHKEALQNYNKELENNRTNVNVLFEKGLNLSRLGRFDDAKDCFKSALDIDPNNFKIKQQIMLSDSMKRKNC